MHMNNKRRGTGIVFRGALAAAVVAALASEPLFKATCKRCGKEVKTQQPVPSGAVFYCSIACAD
jgi:hypothetical protein